MHLLPFSIDSLYAKQNLYSVKHTTGWLEWTHPGHNVYSLDIEKQTGTRNYYKGRNGLLCYVAKWATEKKKRGENKWELVLYAAGKHILTDSHKYEINLTKICQRNWGARTHSCSPSVADRIMGSDWSADSVLGSKRPTRATASSVWCISHIIILSGIWEELSWKIFFDVLLSRLHQQKDERCDCGSSNQTFKF